MECAGLHRGLGSHISNIKSISLDNINEKQLHFIKSNSIIPQNKTSDLINFNDLILNKLI